MAMTDYYVCDKCGKRKTFYDAALHYDQDANPQTHHPWPVGAGDMAVLCKECSKTHKVIIVAKEALSFLESAKAEPPEPVRQDDGGEFVKALRGFSDAIRNLPQYRGTTICSKFDEACDRLNALEKRNRELEAFYAAQSKIAYEAADDNKRLQAHFDAQAEEIERLKSDMIVHVRCWACAKEGDVIKGTDLVCRPCYDRLTAENARLKEELEAAHDTFHACREALDEKIKIQQTLVDKNKALAERIEKLEKRNEILTDAAQEALCTVKGQWKAVGNHPSSSWARDVKYFEQVLKGEKPCTQPK